MELLLLLCAPYPTPLGGDPWPWEAFSHQRTPRPSALSRASLRPGSHTGISEASWHCCALRTILSQGWGCRGLAPEFPRWI